MSILGLGNTIERFRLADHGWMMQSSENLHPELLKQGARVFRQPARSLNAVMCREPMGKMPDLTPDMRWHISVSHDKRVPTWDEMVTVAHQLRPGVPFVVGIPPESWWMNVHPHVLHLLETKDENLIEQWRFESMQGRTPPS